MRALPQIKLRLDFLHGLKLTFAVIIYLDFAVVFYFLGELGLPDDRAYCRFHLNIISLWGLFQLIWLRRHLIIYTTFHSHRLDFYFFFPIVGLLQLSITILKQLLVYVFFNLGIVIGELDLTLVICEALNHQSQLRIIRLTFKLKLVDFLTDIG